MTWIINIPLQVRLLALFLIGAALGSLINLVVDRQRYATPRVSPWNALVDAWRRLLGLSAARLPEFDGKKCLAPPTLGESGFVSLVPIAGWLAVAANRTPEKAWIWRRPLFVELLFALAIPLLYWWQVYPWEINVNAAPRMLFDWALRDGIPRGAVISTAHWQFLLHALFLTFMLAATLIDLDEWIIPDAIAVTGTIAALTFVASSAVPSLFAEYVDFLGSKPAAMMPLDLAVPGPLPAQLLAGGTPGLLLALGCVALWCFGLLPRVWTLRWGFNTGCRLFWRGLTRDRWALLLPIAICIAVSLLCIGVWNYRPVAWIPLLSALVGMTVGGCIIWVIRIVSALVLRREGMGFGDVTLMAMIGAFLGWQPTVIAFFLSPFFGLIPPIISLLAQGRASPKIPFGPFLCLGAAATLFCWSSIWPWEADVLQLFATLGAKFVLGLIGGIVVAMVVLLYGMQWLKRAFSVPRSTR